MAGTPEIYEAYFDHLLREDVPVAVTSIALDINNITNLMDTIPDIDDEQSAIKMLTDLVTLSRDSGLKGVWYSPYSQKSDRFTETPKPGTIKNIFGIQYGPKIAEAAKSLDIETESAFVNTYVQVVLDGSWRVTISHNFLNESREMVSVKTVGNEDIFNAITQPPLDTAERIDVGPAEIKDMWKSVGKIISELNTLG